MKTIYKIYIILLMTITSFVYGWDKELKDAAKAVAAGTATPAQKRRVIKENVTINEMATAGEISDKTYQKSQQAHQELVNKNARSAAKEAGTSISNPDTPVDAKNYAGGTDTDLGLKNQGDSPVTAHQSKKTRENFNRKMNQDLETSGIDYAKKQDVDFMPDPKGHTQKSFTEGNKFNKEPYKDINATKRELKKINGEDPTIKESKAYTDEMVYQNKHKSDELDKLKQDARANKKADPKGETTKSKSTDAQITQKQQKQQKYTERIKGETAEIHRRNELKSDLPDSSDLSRRTADRHRNVTKEKAAEIANKKLDHANKISPDDVTIKEIDTPDGKKTVAEVSDGKGGKRTITEEDITKLNRNNAHTSDAVNDHLTKQAIQNNAEVRASAAVSQGGPGAKQHMADAAEIGNKLTPNKQGELIDKVRMKHGDEAAEELATEMKRQKKEGPGAKAETDIKTTKTKTDLVPETKVIGTELDIGGETGGDIETKVAGGELNTGKSPIKTDIDIETKVSGSDVATGKTKTSVGADTKLSVDANTPKAGNIDAPSKVGQVMDAANKATDGLDLLNTAQDIKEVLSGKKSATDAAIDTADRISGGAISTSKMLVKKGNDYYEANKQNENANKRLEEARAIKAGLDLRKNGVSKEETKQIMTAMRNGDDSLLQQKVNQLGEKGIEIKIPDQVEKGTVESDDTVAERAWATGKGMLEGMEKDAERAGDFIWDMFKDLAEITELSVETKVTDVKTGFKEINAALKRAELRQKLLDKGIDPKTADAALEKLAKGDNSGFKDIRKQLADEQKEIKPNEEKNDKAENKKENDVAKDDNKSNTDETNLDSDTKITKLQDAEKREYFDDGDGFNDDDFSEDKPDPATVFTDKTEENNSDDSKTAQDLNKSVNNIADASTAGDKTMLNSSDIVNQANTEAQNKVNIARNESTADYNENSFGNQMSTEITTGIKSGFETAGTAIGTAIGDAIVRQSIRNNKHNNKPPRNNNVRKPPRNNRKPSNNRRHPPSRNSRPPSKSSSWDEASITSTFNYSQWPICPICGKRHKPNSGTRIKPSKPASRQNPDSSSIMVNSADGGLIPFIPDKQISTKPPTPQHVSGGGQVVPVGTRKK